MIVEQSEKTIEEFVKCFREKFFNRTDTYAAFGYHWYNSKKPLTDKVLENHVYGLETIGSYAQDENGMCKWLSIDIDAHEESDQELAQRRNWNDALVIYHKLEELKIPCLLEDSSGKGSYHLWVFWNQPVHCSLVRSVGLWLTEGMGHEVFPKADTKQAFGTQVRVPGRYHKGTRYHWSRFWRPSHLPVIQWVGFKEDYGFLIDFPTADFNTIPEEARAFKPKAPEKLVESVIARPDVPLSQKQQFAKHYLDKRPGSQEGEGASDYCFALAIDLLWGFDLTVEEALPVFETWGDRGIDVAGGHYPWESWELRHKLEDAQGRPDQEDRPKGYLLDKYRVEIWERQLIDNKLWTEEKTALTEEKVLLMANLSTTEHTDLYDQCFYNTKQFFEAAAKQTFSYIIEGMLEQGGLNIMSGLSFAGKTTFLQAIIGHIVRGTPIFDLKVKPHDVLYVNGDMNPLYRLSRQLKLNLTPDTPGFHYLKQNPDTLSASVLDLYCRIIQTQRPDRPILVILDTTRPLLFTDCQKGDDLDAIVMTKKLKPFKELTQKWNGKLTCLLLYHNARGSDEFYGSGALMNLLDCYWNYTRQEKLSTQSLLKVQTREDYKELSIVMKEDGNFELYEEKMTQGEVVGWIVTELEKRPLTQSMVETELATKAVRNCVRLSWNKLEEHNVIQYVNRKGTLSEKWEVNLTNMKNTLKW